MTLPRSRRGWVFSDWYVVKVHPIHLAAISAKILSLGFPIMAPRTRRDGRLQLRYPGSVFVAFDVYEDDWRRIPHLEKMADNYPLISDGAVKWPVALTVKEAERIAAECGPDDIIWPTSQRRSPLTASAAWTPRPRSSS